MCWYTYGHRLCTSFNKPVPFLLQVQVNAIFNEKTERSSMVSYLDVCITIFEGRVVMHQPRFAVCYSLLYFNSVHLYSYLLFY